MKKISQIAAYSVICIFVLAIIACGIIKVDNKPKMEAGYSIQITDTEATNIGEKISDENVIVFNKKFNESFKISVLYALFSGRLNNKVEMVGTESNLPTFNGYKVQLIYNEENTLYDNGKVVTKSNGSSEAVKYDTVVLSVSQNNLNNVDLYYYLHTESNKYYKFSTIANFDELYNFIAELPNFKK